MLALSPPKFSPPPISLCWVPGAWQGTDRALLSGLGTLPLGGRFQHVRSETGQDEPCLVLMADITEHFQGPWTKFL